MKSPLFIAFEGIDGSGKSTQATLLGQHLAQQGDEVYNTGEPSTGTIGKLLRQILTGVQKADERVIAGLFVADRLDHLLNNTDGIVKQLNEGHTVICDRFYFSSYAYQGTHMDMKWVIEANAMSALVKRPDLNIFIDVAPEVCLQRISSNRMQHEHYETLDNLVKVRDNFFKAFDLLKREEKVLVVDGNRPISEVAEEVRDSITRYF